MSNYFNLNPNQSNMYTVPSNGVLFVPNGELKIKAAEIPEYSGNVKFEIKLPEDAVTLPLAPPETKKETCLEAAARVVDGPRQSSYGHPYVNHGTTAKYWTTYLERRFPGIVITGEDVCMMQLLMKVSREGNSHNDDNPIDIAGYARNYEMVREERIRLGEITE